MTETASEAAAATNFAPGAPNWIDLSSPDIKASTAFYTGLFGWNAMDLGEDAGGYVMFETGGRIAAAVGPLQEGAHPAWMVYFNTADDAATAASVTDAGGQVIVPPFDVMDQGRMGVYADVTGAFFSTWQPKLMPGLGIKGEANSFGWCELNTTDVSRATEFYGKVFGWEAHRSSASTPDFTYTELKVEGERFGGAVNMAETGMPAGIPPHWLIYFNVAGIEGVVASVRELGGNVMMEPMPYPGGRFAVVADPQGIPFGLMTIDE